MDRTLIKDLRSVIGQTIKLQGWLQTLRDQKKIQFLILRDPTGLAQVAHWKPNDEVLAELIAKMGAETALTITGKVIDNPIVKLNGLEIQLESLEVDNMAEIPLPFDPFAETLPTIDYRLDWRYMDLRRSVNALLFQVQTSVEMAMREYWVKNKFIEVHSPKLMGTPSESGAELFSLDYFERKAYLAQSPQFYKQMAMAAGFERIFEIGPVFRADPSFTSRHMTEFTGVDMEISWINSHEDVMAFEERWLQYIYTRVKELHGDAIKKQFGVDLVIPEVPFPRIPMREAVEILKSRGYALPADKKGDIDPGGEREIAAYVKEKFNHDFVFLTDWPISVRPFYHMRIPEDQTLTRSFDLIACGLEITTGAQREHRVEMLQKQALEKGLHLEPIQFYLDFFRYGCPSHGGFGLGLSRLMMAMLNLNNIREVVYIFRGPTRLNP
ncbi:MAG: aspartyl-tRNA synthetase [Chloroflexi bacterium]|nr:MAG: aspartyl-tRNA synthetase [Chloroflexota bacterium]MBA4376210.1 aspartate--tRNA(Asn) ligase [Anaerolinea sp.]